MWDSDLVLLSQSQSFPTIPIPSPGPPQILPGGQGCGGHVGTGLSSQASPAHLGGPFFLNRDVLFLYTVLSRVLAKMFWNLTLAMSLIPVRFILSL